MIERLTYQCEIREFLDRIIEDMQELEQGPMASWRLRHMRQEIKELQDNVVSHVRNLQADIDYVFDLLEQYKAELAEYNSKL